MKTATVVRNTADGGRADRAAPEPVRPPSFTAVAALALVALAFPSAARASFLPPEMMDTMATYISWFVVIVVPIGAIVLFWMVHVLPEKIAHKRHHPQRDAIHTLCLLSLVFGGLLWPIAWLWAYTSRSVTGPPTAPTSTRTTTTSWARRRRRANCWSMISRTCAKSSMRWRKRER